MIILNDKPGKLCNRLWAFSFFIAYAMKYRVRIYIPNFREYGPLFENLTSVPNVHFAIVKEPPFIEALTYQCYRLITKLLRIISSFISLTPFGVYVDPRHWTHESWDFSILNKEKNIVFLGSWFHPKKVAVLLECKDALVKLFQPKGIFKKRVDAEFLDLRSRHDVIVGIHIRRGDYAAFHDGAYLFDDSVYQEYMKAIEEAMAGKKICFFIASDEPVDCSQFKGHNATSLEAPAMVEDLYALSRCDYILGPPSTFSMWASFIGGVPLRIVQYGNETISLNQFSPILYQNVFKNGERFRHLDDNPATALHEKSFIA